MKDIEEQLDRLKERLPKNYEVQICVEGGEAWLQVITPDFRRVPIEGDDESCWSMLMADALVFCHADKDQMDSESVNQQECKHDWQWQATGAGMGHYCHKCDSFRSFKANAKDQPPENNE